MKRKILSVILTLAMALSLLPATALAAKFGDTEGHWAEKSIERWSNAGVLNGSNGMFDPNGFMTRGQAAQVFTNLLGLKSTEGAATFSDVAPDAWYADAIAKVNAAGIMGGVGDGKMDPEAPVSREMFFTMFARALGIKPQESTSGAPADGASWSAGYINALTDKGFVKGTDNGVEALATMNRASMAALLDQTVTTYANTDGATVEAAPTGVTLVVADNVTVTGTADTVVVAAEEGSVNLNKATVETLNVVSADAEVNIGAGSKVETVAVAETASDANVAVASGATVQTMETAAENTAIDNRGVIASVSVAETASGTELKAESGSYTGTVETAASGTSVSGNGAVAKVETSGDETSVSTRGTTVETTTETGTTTSKNNGTVPATSSANATAAKVAASSTGNPAPTTQTASSGSGGGSHQTASALNFGVPDKTGDNPYFGKALANLVDNYTVSTSGTTVTVSGALKYISGWTAFSSVEAERSGFYLPIKITKPESMTNIPSGATISAGKNGSEYAYNVAAFFGGTNGGADYENGDTLIMLVGKENCVLNNFKVTIDWDGNGSSYSAKTYTVDVSGISMIIPASEAVTLTDGATLSSNLTVAEGATLTIPEGKTLTIADGATLTNNGTVTGLGTVTVKSGSIWEGNVFTWADDSSQKAAWIFEAGSKGYYTYNSQDILAYGSESDGGMYLLGTGGKVTMKKPGTNPNVVIDGAVTLNFDQTIASGEVYEIASGATLTVPEGKTLTIADGATLINNGTVTGLGTVTVKSGGIWKGNVFAWAEGDSSQMAAWIFEAGSKGYYTYNSQDILAYGSESDGGMYLLGTGGKVTMKKPGTNPNVVIDGAVTLNFDQTIASGEVYEIASGATLTVPEGKTLTIADGATLTNNGTVTGLGTVTVKSGSIWEGNVFTWASSDNEQKAAWIFEAGSKGYIGSQTNGILAYGSAEDDCMYILGANGKVAMQKPLADNPNVYIIGEVTLNFDQTIASGEIYEIASGATLTIPEGKTLTIADGATLINGGTVVNRGTVTIAGTFQNDGDVDNSGGTIGSSGVFVRSGSGMLTNTPVILGTIYTDAGSKASNQANCLAFYNKVFGASATSTGWPSGIKDDDAYYFTMIMYPTGGGNSYTISASNMYQAESGISYNNYFVVWSTDENSVENWKISADDSTQSTYDNIKANESISFTVTHGENSATCEVHNQDYLSVNN